MRLESLKLTNFRNYSNLKINLSQNINIFYGKNGVGKTNLVESIYFLALTKSFRVNNDKFMLKDKEEGFSIEGKVVNKSNATYKIVYQNNKKNLYINGTKIKSVSDYISRINVILFNPEDINVIKDSPSERRKLVNIELSKLDKEYLILVANYNKILKLRNAYLKKLAVDGSASKEYLKILTNKMVDFGIEICAKRDEFINDVKAHIKGIYLDIFGYGKLNVSYKSAYKNKTKEEIISTYEKNYQKEILLGKTFFGIQHDDLAFTLDSKSMKEWGSTGQIKNAIISFKLAEVKILEEKYKVKPILILDDLFSELDKEKVDNILKIMNKQLQVFITTTSIKNINMKKFDNYKIYKVEKEQITEEKNE